MTGAEYMGLVAQLPCALCGGRKCLQVHHRRRGQGWGRASDFDTIPLCEDHHQGDLGIHGLGTKLFEIVYGTTEAALVERTRDLLGFTAAEVEVWKQAERDRG